MHPVSQMVGVGSQAGGYELVHRLASGGMGEVFVARKRVGGTWRRFAVKVLLPHLSEDPKFVAMFLDEARLAARMAHPNIVPIVDIGEVKGRHYVVMPFVDGVSLSMLIKRCRELNLRLPLPVVRLIGQGLCGALSYAHALRDDAGQPLGIVHRDVTPSNVLLSTHGEVLLTDFGIARATNSVPRTQAGKARGTPPYMAPEQFRSSSQVDCRADVYSAAVTLFEALTLTSPFLRPSDPEVMEAVLFGATPDAGQARSDVTPTLAAALAIGMSRDRDARFPTAQALAEALSDGPVAKLAELGGAVDAVRGDRLPASVPGATEGTDLLVAAAAVRQRPARVAAALGLAAVATTGFALFLLQHTKQSTKAPVPAVALARPEQDVGAQKPEPVAVGFPSEASGGTAPADGAPVETGVAGSASATDAGAAPVLQQQLASGAESNSPPMGTAGNSAASRRPSERRTTPQRRMGYLTVDVKPWATVYVDGAELDRTPISRMPVAVGRRTLVFKNPNFTQTLTRTVRIEEDRELTLNLRF